MLAWLIVITLSCPGSDKLQTQELWFEKKPPVHEAFEATWGTAVFARCRIVQVSRAMLKKVPAEFLEAFRAGLKIGK